MILKNPTKVYFDNRWNSIRYDMWSVLDIIKCFNDYDLDQKQRTVISLDIFYYDMTKIKDYQSAIEKMCWFIDCGDESPKKEQGTKKKVMDWEQDFNLIKAPVNRILGYDIGGKNIHWWTFMSAYMEIFSNENCLFANVLNIRQKINKGTKLEKHERKFYNENRDIIELKNELTPEQLEESKRIFGVV